MCACVRACAHGFIVGKRVVPLEGKWKMDMRGIQCVVGSSISRTFYTKSKRWPRLGGGRPI